MTKSSEQYSFVNRVKLLIADVESKESVDESDLQQLEACIAFSSLLWLSHNAISKPQGEPVTSAKLNVRQKSHRQLVRHYLDVIAGREQHELLDKDRAKELLIMDAKSADMLVALVRRAMLELGLRTSDSTSST